ncbi:hypothetical protein HNR46_004006, partial [Haloferula luteola]|nr:hypothetical protein [Haloferula luteola]
MDVATHVNGWFFGEFLDFNGLRQSSWLTGFLIRGKRLITRQIHASRESPPYVRERIPLF